MSCMAYIPLDDTVRDGRSLSLRAADKTLHAGSWHAGRHAFVYSDGTRIAPTITHYLARTSATRSVDQGHRT